MFKVTYGFFNDKTMWLENEEEIRSLSSALYKLEETLLRDRCKNVTDIPLVVMREYVEHGYINAIKMYRSLTGCGLKDTKDYVDQLIAMAKKCVQVTS
jgi:ribosomal protein L7/L12